MQTFLVISDGSAEIRIPINARVETPTAEPVKTPPQAAATRVVKRYPRGTKESAVRLVFGGARPADVRQSLGVAVSTLDNWLWEARRKALA